MSFFALRRMNDALCRQFAVRLNLSSFRSAVELTIREKEFATAANDEPTLQT